MNGPVDTGNKLLHKLHQIRNNWAGGPPEALREALSQALREETEGLSVTDSDQLLGNLEHQVVSEARSREERLESLEAEVRRLTAERDRLAEENGRLEAEPRSAVPEAPGATTDSLDRLQDGLRKFLERQRVTEDSLGLSPPHAAFFRFILELLRFTVRFEHAILELQKNLSVGPVAEMVTRVFQQYQENLEQQLRDCIDDKPGAIDSLKEMLTRNSKFLIDLNKAHEEATVKGGRALLEDLDPEPILERTKGGRLKWGGYEQAWKEITKVHGDLMSLPPSELYERYCFQEFQERLSAHLGARAKKE